MNEYGAHKAYFRPEEAGCVKHCKKPKGFLCPLPWCRYIGTDEFARKDKLTGHYNNIHKAESRLVKR